MVTAKTQYNLKHAREHFEDHLGVVDNYNEGQRVAGEWLSEGAEKLGGRWTRPRKMELRLASRWYRIYAWGTGGITLLYWPEAGAGRRAVPDTARAIRSGKACPARCGRVN